MDPCKLFNNFVLNFPQNPSREILENQSKNFYFNSQKLNCEEHDKFYFDSPRNSFFINDKTYGDQQNVNFQPNCKK
jgi:hypothetical protein